LLADGEYFRPDGFFAPLLFFVLPDVREEDFFVAMRNLLETLMTRCAKPVVWCVPPERWSSREL
jgi:hypothetical protein